MKAVRSWSMVAVAVLLLVLSGCSALNEAATSELRKEPALIERAAISADPLQATYSGTTLGGPMWYRPAWGGEWYVTDKYVPYHVQQLSVAADANYVIYSVQDGYDGYLYVYEGAFDPASQLDGLLARGDDYSSNRDSLIEIGLVNGTTYFIVSSTYYSESAGPFTNFIYGPAAVTLGEADPVEATSDLIADVEELVDEGVLKTGQAKGLVKPLESALRSLEKEHTSDACNQVADFILEVDAKVPPLTEIQAESLIGSADAIRQMLGCE